MPILPKETAIYPERLLEDELLASSQADEDDPPRWWVLHTKPRQEKALARQLLELDAAFYLPLYAKRNRVRGRLQVAHVPLFDGYLFLWGTLIQRQKAFQTQRVVQAIAVNDPVRLIQDLRQVKLLLDTGRPVTPLNHLEPGDEVEIKAGPLSGLRGTIISSTRNQRFVVKVDFIQRGAAIEIEDVDLTPVKSTEM